LQNNSTLHPKVSGITIAAAVIVFLLSGLISSYLYCKMYETIGVIFPGIIYASATIIVLIICKVPVKATSWLMYYVLIVVIYLAMWILTMFSSWFAFLGGIITSGTGAILVFYITNRYIIKFHYSKSKVFIAGAIAFLIADILALSIQDPVMGFFVTPEDPSSIALLYADVFFHWHVIVGLIFIFTLKNQEE
jgi:hypothetical protein